MQERIRELEYENTINNTLHTKFGTAKINKKYYYISTSKEGNHNKLLHRLIWEDFYDYKIPNGFIIHHKNGNTFDNCILNLQLMRETDHMSLHQKNIPKSEEHKRKIGEAHKGKTVSDKTRRKLSNAFKGEKNPNYGKHLSDETKRKMSESKTYNYYRIVKAGFHHTGKQRYGINFKGKFIKTSLYRDRLLNWFTENYPFEILVLHKEERIVT